MKNFLDGSRAYLLNFRKKYSKNWKPSETNHDRIICLLSALADNPHIVPEVTERIEMIMREEVISCVREMNAILDEINIEIENPNLPSPMISVIRQVADEYQVPSVAILASVGQTSMQGKLIYTVRLAILKRLMRLGYNKETAMLAFQRIGKLGKESLWNAYEKLKNK